MIASREKIEAKLSARKLPEGARLHPEFGIMKYSDIDTLQTKYQASKFDGLEDRDLEIVPASSVGAYYDCTGNWTGAYRQEDDIKDVFNVVISRPKAEK